MAVIDFHSHVLPGIDDGSRNLETSVGILQEASRQGVDCMVATPHFYAARDRISDFLDRRQKAEEKLRACLTSDLPRLITGAEVAYFEGCSDAERLEDLTIGNSRVLLLEFPFDVWNSKVTDEVRYMMESRNFTIVTAHLERYSSIKENRKELKRLLELPIVVQVNAGSLADWKRRGGTLRLLRNAPHFVLGSDCHGLNHRPPNLLDGRSVLLKRMGRDRLDQMDQFGTQLLAMNSVGGID